MSVTTESDLARAIERGDDTIEIEGDLAKKTLRIKATGRVAWAVAFGAIGVAVYAAIATLGTGGAAAPVAGFAAASAGGAAIGVLGSAATATAISMAVAVKSISVLKKLRQDYSITKTSSGSVILRRQ